VCPECRTPRDEFEDTILETMDLWDENESPLQAVQRMGAALTQLYPTAELMEANAHRLAALRGDQPHALQTAGFMQAVARTMRTSGIGGGL
jgi:hypothetical protein